MAMVAEQSVNLAVNLDLNLEQMGRAARTASRRLASYTANAKNAALLAIAAGLEARIEAILAVNAQDMVDARAKGLTPAMLDRLLLDEARVRSLAEDTRKVAALPDPVGAELEGRLLPNGMRLSKRRIPIGVLGVIYEARPNVTIDIATLSLKTGNAVILRGGSETLRSNLALVETIQEALAAVAFPIEAVQYIDSPDRALVTQLLRLDHYVDMIIPRGGAALHKLCREQATIPVITGGIGVCHLFVDASADLARSLDIIENARVQRPSVCNSCDTVLVHQDVAAEFLPLLAERMARCMVELRAAEGAYEVLSHTSHGATVFPAGPDDFDQEWMALILGVKVVDGVEAAIQHIYDHGSEHSDGILTNDFANAGRFVEAINSSAVFVNASTRFNDGGQFGLGAEVAVSTQKLHARGPMGLEELTTYKWVCIGNWDVRP
jgi:glutamate-5-semialdehyde dehydrogenase